jgi:hypothetical protein
MPLLKSKRDKEAAVKTSKFFLVFVIVCGLPSFPLSSQAEHNVKNGCGDDTFFGSLVPNAPVGASFRQACDDHDWCYGELGQSKDYCDRQFHNEMLEECRRTFDTMIARPLRATCSGVANMYYSAVNHSSNAARTYSDSKIHARLEAFRWSQSGSISGRTCIQVYENDDLNAWSDNYLCADRDFGLQWSQAGEIAGMKCTQVYENADPHSWSDNFLCLPNSSLINFRWSQSGAISGMTCTRIYEDADLPAWHDNFLCY